MREQRSSTAQAAQRGDELSSALADILAVSPSRPASIETRIEELHREADDLAVRFHTRKRAWASVEELDGIRRQHKTRLDSMLSLARLLDAQGGSQ